MGDASRRNLLGFTITTAGRIRMQLADGTTHQFEDPAADAEMIRTLAENNALATDRLEPGAEFIASPARGNAGICFLRVEKGPVQ